MKAYAGIGSRNITDKEKRIIRKIAKELSKKYILYSGNADGADISFQEGSEGNCVVFLPWSGFNADKYNDENAIFIVPEETRENINSVLYYHPAPNSLKRGGLAMMRRNYHQVAGYDKFPEVDFVVCCADFDSNGVKGGTGQACRIAYNCDIPVINIREEGWKEKLMKVLKGN